MDNPPTAPTGRSTLVDRHAAAVWCRVPVGTIDYWASTGKITRHRVATPNRRHRVMYDLTELPPRREEPAA
ncbi:hypothetical protein ACN20G_28260 (plasmid) [Streptomyces sp. BI20]|uniref:hypothetical protein n=1 Tax=Streptomyces sp. BI20 TaxID=3403460 RepID=UPI003C7953CA